MKKMTRLGKVIEQVKAVRHSGIGGWIFDSNGNIKEDVICGEVLPLLEEMKNYEINVNDKYIEDFLNRCYNYETIDGNTYNYNACISEHIDWKAFETNNNCFFLVKIHLYGDIRSGYSDYFVLKMEDYQEFWELENWLQFKTINDQYSVDIYLNQECYDLIDNENQENLGEYYEPSIKDLLKSIKENMVNTEI